jgi:hypothetical protein
MAATAKGLLIAKLMEHEDMFLEALCRVHGRDPAASLLLLQQYAAYQIAKAAKALDVIMAILDAVDAVVAGVNPS